MEAALSYCPAGHFFNSQVTVCGFREPGKALVLPGLKQVFVGFDKHNSKCCEVCKTCKEPLKSKDMANWKECKGDSVNDVQNFCMEKCAPGYWNEVNTSQCHKCSTCHDGIL
jgi:hypothetical protein